MTPIATLKDEHEVILKVLDAAERAADAISETLARDPDWLDGFIDFVRNFADRCHHGKEEKRLFGLMELRGIPREGGPIGVMLQEHEQGRAFIRAVADASQRAKEGDPAAAKVVSTNLKAYVQLLRSHIAKENDILFVMAEQVLTDEDRRELAEAFEGVEAEEMGQGVHERYHELAHRLASH